MKVKDLIKELKDADPEREVIMQKDAEGNGYSPLADFWEGNYFAETTWFGECYIEKLTDELIQKGFSDEDLGPKEGQVSALILCPVN